MKQLTAPGQIKPGDTIHCEFKGKPQRYRVKEVLHPGTDKEEILINKRRISTSSPAWQLPDRHGQEWFITESNNPNLNGPSFSEVHPF